MAADIFDKEQHLLPLKQRTAVHRSGRLVCAFLQPNGVNDAVELGLRDLRIGQFDLVNVRHQVAKHTPLATTGGHHPFSAALNMDVGTFSRAHRCDTRLADLAFTHGPVHRDRFDLLNRLDQALVAQKTQHQQLRLAAQRHQRHELALVEVHRQGPFGRNGRF